MSETKSEAEKAAEEWARLSCGEVPAERILPPISYLTLWKRDKKMLEEGFLAGVQWAAPKWISVKERLPEDSGRYLVCLGGESVQLYYFTPERGFYHTYHSSDMPCTHWQPLPAAPEEEK